jgi:hypothetical protein
MEVVLEDWGRPTFERLYQNYGTEKQRVVKEEKPPVPSSTLNSRHCM